MTIIPKAAFGKEQRCAPLTPVNFTKVFCKWKETVKSPMAWLWSESVSKGQKYHTEMAVGW